MRCAKLQPDACPWYTFDRFLSFLASVQTSRRLGPLPITGSSSDWQNAREVSAYTCRHILGLFAREALLSSNAVADVPA